MIELDEGCSNTITIIIVIFIILFIIGLFSSNKKKFDDEFSKCGSLTYRNMNLKDEIDEKKDYIESLEQKITQLESKIKSIQTKHVECDYTWYPNEDIVINDQTGEISSVEKFLIKKVSDL